MFFFFVDCWNDSETLKDIDIDIYLKKVNIGSLTSSCGVVVVWLRLSKQTLTSRPDVPNPRFAQQVLWLSQD